MVNLTINNKSIAVDEGKTILQTARQVGLDIPTLCEHPHLPPYGACGICVVEAQGNPKLIRACAMPVSEGMVIFTDTPRVRANRRQALELLLSDHTGDCRPPCTLACPAQTDCQGYVGLIANGEYTQARRLIMEKIPLPASIGRICPHPCEDACRRKLVENPIAIADLKRFAADAVGSMEDAADRVEDTGCSIAIVGGGPGGLSAGYFLRLAGHAVTIFDAMPQMGGMLRYGIPEYRLPKNVLQAEIDHIAGLGVELVNNRRLGADLSLGELRENYDAVILAVGAWSSSPLRCVGEELDGVLGGINFLRDTALGKHFGGKSVAVVGGGNTAMDACRTAVRLGADKVYNIYRRTINEMPAEEIEIIEAQEEGVVFKNLTNPLEILGENGKVTAIRLQIMELGEPDDSGRRAPVPVAGKEETLEVDTVIAAIGQKLQGDGLEEVAKTRWGTIIADDESFLTNLEGVFAIGDATNHGADIAITAIGEAKKAVDMVCAYLKGEELSFNPQKLVKSEKTQEDFAGEERVSRIKMPHRCASERKKDFGEINRGFSEEEAKREANRCLECGCMDYFECRLLELANEYGADFARFNGVKNHGGGDKQGFIRRDSNKCILCGICSRVCGELADAWAIGRSERGFDAAIKPAFDLPFEESGCICCGNCVAYCPTGALTEKQMLAKQVPVQEEFEDVRCELCELKCAVKLGRKGKLITRALPHEGGLLCHKGRFGLGIEGQEILPPISEEMERGLLARIEHDSP